MICLEMRGGVPVFITRASLMPHRLTSSWTASSANVNYSTNERVYRHHASLATQVLACLKLQVHYVYTRRERFVLNGEGSSAWSKSTSLDYQARA
jgi:hypothetical protein